MQLLTRPHYGELDRPLISLSACIASSSRKVSILSRNCINKNAKQPTRPPFSYDGIKRSPNASSCYAYGQLSRVQRTSVRATPLPHCCNQVGGRYYYRLPWQVCMASAASAEADAFQSHAAVGNDCRSMPSTTLGSASKLSFTMLVV